MNSTQKVLLFLFAFTQIGITQCAHKPRAHFKEQRLALILQTRQMLQRNLCNNNSASPSSGRSARPGTPIENPLVSPKKQTTSFLTPPSARQYLRSPASQQQSLAWPAPGQSEQPPRSPRITGQACAVVVENPTTPQPAGALAVPASAATPAHSAPAPMTVAAQVKVADAVQRQQTAPASALHSASCKQCKKNALHKQYLQPRDFIEQNKDNPDILDDFFERRQHFFAMRSSQLGLPLPPSLLKLSNHKKRS